MDPITIFGAVASSVQITQFIGKTIQSLSTLKGKYRDADATIRSLIGQLSTIKAAMVQVRDWAEFNSEETPKGNEFLTGLHIALDGCQAVMDALSDEIADLIAGAELTANVTLGMRVKIKTIWNENSMKGHQDRLSGQVQALQFLLIATQCRDASSQSRLLGSKENQMLITRIAEDTRSIRESRSSVHSQAGESVEMNDELDFDRTQKFLAADVAGLVAIPTRRDPKGLGRPISKGDRGLGTGASLSTTMPETVLFLSDHSSVGTTKTRQSRVTSTLQSDTTSQCNKNKSTSVARKNFLSLRHLPLSSSRVLRERASPSASTGKKFWSSPLAHMRLINASQTSLSDPEMVLAEDNSSANRQWSRRLVSNTQSVDIISVDGSETPMLVRAAQAGNSKIIENMLATDTDVEIRHTPSNRTALSVAAHCGNAEIVRLLIQHDANIDSRDFEGSNPLHLAASRNHLEVMRALLSEGSDPESLNERQETPLWIAADRGHFEAAKLVLRHGARVNTRARHQLSPLHATAKRGCPKTIELLLSRNAHREARDSNSMTALHHACENGNCLAVHILMKKGADVEAVGRDSMSPLICAASRGHHKVVQLLLARKLTSAFKKDNRCSKEKISKALLCASEHGHLEVVEYLLDGKASVHVTDPRGLSPLHLAVIGSHFQVVDYLLMKKSSANLPCKEGQTPLHYACQNQNEDIVNRLLNAGASPGLVVPSNRKQAVHFAAATGSVNIINLLHNCGSTLNSSDSAGDRPICIACREGNLEVVARLLELGAPLRASFKDSAHSDSPLCMAVKAGHLDIVRHLVNAGSSIKQRDENGHIPLRHAAYFGHPEVLEFLLLQGADLIDDGEIPNSWGFVLVPDLIGFSSSNSISEDRKQRVRDLLGDAARIVGGGYKDGYITFQNHKKPGLYRQQSPEIRDGKKRAY